MSDPPIDPDPPEDSTPEPALFITYPISRQRMMLSGLKGPLNIALLTESYTPSVNHNVFGDVSEHEVTGPGYISGGRRIAYSTFFSTVGRRDYILRLATDVSWPASLFDVKWVIAMQEDPLGAPIQEWPLVGYADINAGQGKLTIRTGTLVLRWASRNLIRIR